MDRFEQKLSELPLARPSIDLKQRIFGGMGESPARSPWFAGIARYGVPLAWAASIAVIAGLAGALLTSAPDDSDRPMMMMPAEESVTVQLESERNVFDFSKPGAESMYDDIDVMVTVDEEA